MENFDTCSNHVFAKIIYPQQRIATHLTGLLPVTSNRVNKYLFLLYEYDINSILVRTINNIMDK